MYMDESEEEEEQNAGRFGGQQTGQVGQSGFAQGQGQGQQPQMNRISPRGAITAGVAGEAASCHIKLHQMTYMHRNQVNWANTAKQPFVRATTDIIQRCFAEVNKCAVALRHSTILIH